MAISLIDYFNSGDSKVINNDGYLVDKGSLFDNGDNLDIFDVVTDSTFIDDVVPSTKKPSFFDAVDGVLSPPTSAGVFSNPDNYVQDLYDEISKAADQVNQNSINAADRAMEFEKQQIDDYRAWQERMYDLNWNRQMEASNTSYQRAMEDMRKAGINPKLVAQLGGASTPSVSVPSSSVAGSSMPTFQMSNFNALASLLSTYISGADSLDRNQNDFVKSIITTFIAIMPYL